MKTFQKFLALVLSVLMLAGMGVGVVSGSAADSTDSDHIYAINYLAALDVFKGYGNGNKGASDPVQRYQMALFIARAITGQTNDAQWKGDSAFTDLTGYAGEVSGAVAFVENMGIIEGYGAGKFGPYDSITYQDALTMMIRALGYDDGNISYPYGYVQKAISLKLTTGISGIGYGKALTRGTVAQLIYNMLGAKISGTSGKASDNGNFLAMNFDAKEKQMILVATNNMADPSETLINLPIQKTTKNGSVQFQDAYSGALVRVDADEANINVPEGHSIDEYIGYGFTVLYNSENKVIGAELNAYETFSNVGDLLRGFLPVYQNNSVKDPTLIKVGETIYRLVDQINENEVNYPQLVLFKYGTDKNNVLVPMGTDVKALYEGWSNTSYLNYGKLVMIDTDSDGFYDRAIYSPYTYGIYGVKIALDESNDNAETSFAAVRNYDAADNLSWRFLASGASMTDKQFENQKFVVSQDADGNCTQAASRLDDLKITGSANAGDVVVYCYNSFFNTLEFITSAPVQKGRLTSFSNYFVTISKVGLYAGIYGHAAGMPTLQPDAAKDYIFAGYSNRVGTDPKKYYQSTISKALTGLMDLGANDNNIYYAVLPGGKYKQVAYMELIPTEGKTQSTDYNFVVISSEWSENKKSNNETKVTVDENQNIVISAITEAGGNPQTIKISKIVSTAGIASGKLADAKTAYGKNYNYRGTDCFKNEVTGEIDIELTGENVAKLFDAAQGGQNLFTVVSENDGVYVLNMDLGYKENKEAVHTEKTAENVKMIFKSGVSSAKLIADDSNISGYGFNAGRLILTADSEIVLIGADGVVTYHGIPENGAYINVRTDDLLYNVTNDLLVIKTAQNVLADGQTVYSWAKSGSAGLVEDKDTAIYVALKGSGYVDTAYVETVDGVSTYAHTYGKLLNLRTLEVEDVTVVNTETASNITITSGTVYTVAKNTNGYNEITRHNGTTLGVYEIACVLGYNFGTLTEVGDQYAIHITGDKGGVETRVGVTNEDVACGSGSGETALVGGYKIHYIALEKDSTNAHTLKLVTDNASQKAFADLNEDEPGIITAVPCAYLYDKATDSVVVITIEG